MDDSIKVHVVKYPDRDNLVMRYKCPATGKQVSRSTGTSKKKDAAKVAAKWESELQEGRYQKTPRMPWDEFRRFFEDNTIEGMKATTASKYASTLNSFESLCRPTKLGDLTTAKVTAFTAELRKERTREVEDDKVEKYRLTEATVASHLRHLKAVARWANKQGLLPAVPTFNMPKRAHAQRMKGRPITGEEFDRLIDAVEAVVGEDAADSWKYLLRGLWWSGLRLSEAMALRWDHQPGGVSVRLDGRKSVLAFDADAQKSGKTQLVPLAPEAVELIESNQQERGYVFNPHKLRGKGDMARDAVKVSKIIGKIGAKAGIIVDPERGKTASAHDLRRSFGTRWAKLLMPAELRSLMRHAAIETTMAYYVGHDATATAGALWDAVGTKQGSNEPKRKRAEQKTP